MRRLIHRFVSVGTVAVLVVAWLAGALALGLATNSGATATVTLMALGLLVGGLLLLFRHSLDLAARIGNSGTESQRTLSSVRRIEPRIWTELNQTFRQFEAIQNLSAILPTSDVLPASRGYAQSV